MLSDYQSATFRLDLGRFAVFSQDYQVGVNFANDTEAEEFHHTVEAACG